MSVSAAQPGLLLSLIPLLPLAGAATLWCGAWCGLRTPGRSIALPAAGLSLLAIVAAILVLGVGDSPRTLTGGRWLALRDGAGGSIDISLRWDGLTALWLLVQNAAACLVLLDHGERERSESGARSNAVWSLALLGLVDLLALAGNYWLLFVCWELSLIAAWRLLASAAANEIDARAAHRMLWTGLICDLPLLVGLLAIWQAYGSLEYASVFQPVVSNPSAPESAADVMRGFATFCLVISAMCRCAQFPACNWLPPAAGLQGTAAIRGTLIGVMPAGAFLLLRSSPLLATSPAALLLLVNWGCLSAAVWGCLALTQPDARRALASFVAGTLGLVCAGIGAAGAFHPETSTFLVGNLIMLTAGLLWLVSQTSIGDADADTGRASRAALCLAILLASGIWGQEAVLRSLWQPAKTEFTSEPLEPQGADLESALPATSRGSSLAVPLAAIAGHLLLSVGLFRALFRGRPESHRNGIGGPGVIILMLVAGLTGPVLFSARPELSGWRPVDGIRGAGLVVRLCTPGMTGLLMLLALLLAWLLSTRSAETSPQFAQRFDSLARLSRRGFYVDEACRLCCGLPLAICANVCRFLELHVWEHQQFSGDDGILRASDAAGEEGVDGRSLMPLLALFVAAGAVLIILLLEG